MDRKLGFKPHIKTKTAATMRAYITIARLTNTEKGLSSEDLRQLYITCVTTVRDCGVEAWWKNQKVQCKTLQRIQNQALRKIVRAIRTTRLQH